MSPHEPATLGSVVALLDRRYPPGTAESWDAVGLVVGDPDQPVRRVMFAVDPTAAVVGEAIEWGADLLVTHHPLLLRPVHSIAATSAKGAVLHRLVRAGVALYTAHTNADAAKGGVAEALALAVGLVDLVPLAPAAEEATDKHVVFVPSDGVARLIDAMSAAGAGEQGDYSRCAWTVSGVGTFIPGPAARPAIGTRGEQTRAAETRVEMIAPRRVRERVLAAMHEAHPYEEPAFDVLPLADWDGPTGTGRVGRLPEPMTFGELGRHIAGAVPATVQGVRLSGDVEAVVETVAVVGGSGDSLFDLVRASGADVYVTADLRHHPASELRERAEFEAGRDVAGDGVARPFLVDLAHFASEWPWLRLAERDLAADLGADGTTVVTRVSTQSTDPWSARIASTEGTTP